MEDGGGGDTNGPSVQETQKGKEGVSSLFGVWGFFLRTVVWCKCPLRHPGANWDKDEGLGVTPWSERVLALRCLRLVVWNTCMIVFSGRSRRVPP